MGVYLLIVGTLDVAFRDEYNRHARQWMTSWRCTAVGLLAMMSCEVSVLILSLITIERYRFVCASLQIEVSNLLFLIVDSSMSSVTIVMCVFGREIPGF